MPLCALLTAVRRLEDLFRKPADSRPQRLLIVKLVEQGATVIAEPALRRAVEIVGRDNVFVAVFAENRAILDLLEIVPAGNILALRSSKLIWVAIDSLRAIWRMRREKIDTAVDFEFFSRFSGALIYFSGARRRIGFHSFAGEAGYRGDLMTHRIAYNVALHVGQTYRVLVEAVTMRPSQLPAMEFKPEAGRCETLLRPDKSEIAEVRALVERRLVRKPVPPLFLLNANSGDLLPLRRWPDERYVQLARQLLKHYPNIAIAITGSPDEQRAGEELAKRVGSDRCISVAGYTTLRQLLVLYELSEILVSNDSGPAHFASLTPVEVVTLFGPETPAVFGSQSPRSHVIWAGLACSPCVNAFNQRVTTCTNNLCMQHISVDEVFATVCRVYDQRCRDGIGRWGVRPATAQGRLE
jgi:ADP-heptose:LPS heptosyltransferase